MVERKWNQSAPLLIPTWRRLSEEIELPIRKGQAESGGGNRRPGSVRRLAAALNSGCLTQTRAAKALDQQAAEHLGGVLCPVRDRWALQFPTVLMGHSSLALAMLFICGLSVHPSAFLVI